MEMHETEDGVLIVLDARNQELFSLSLLDQKSPFFNMCGGKITITAANGRWVYRPIGWDHFGWYGSWDRGSVRAVLESSETFEVPVWE